MSACHEALRWLDRVKNNPKEASRESARLFLARAFASEWWLSVIGEIMGARSAMLSGIPRNARPSRRRCKFALTAYFASRRDTYVDNWASMQPVGWIRRNVRVILFQF